MIWLRLTKPKPIMHANTPRLILSLSHSPFFAFYPFVFVIVLYPHHLRLIAWIYKTMYAILVFYCLNKSSIYFHRLLVSNLSIQINTIFEFTSNYLHNVKKMCGTKQQIERTNKYEMMRRIFLSNMKIYCE